MRFALYLALLLLAACSDPVPETIDGAMQAYGRNRVAEAEAVFRKIAADPASSAADRGSAHRQLGRIAWLIDGDSRRALREIAAAAGMADRCSTARLESRVLQEAKRGDLLLARLELLLKACDRPELADQIRLRAVAAALDLAAAGRKDAVGASARLLQAVGAERREGLPGASIGLQLALLQGDAPAALKAWKDYFWLSAGDVPQGLSSAYPAAAPVFEAGLDPAAGAPERLRLVDLLVRAGFAQAAERFARSAGLDRTAASDPLWGKAKAYFEARRRLETEVLASNRRVARGGSAADLEGLLDSTLDSLMAGARESGDRKAALLRAYSVYARASDSDGYDSIHFGHAVERGTWPVEQYGHRARATFIALDNMAANGFNSWLWDGSAATGGWAEEGPVIVQIRPEFTSSPFTAWALYSGGPARAELLEELKREEAADLAALTAGDVAYLPGLASRIHLQVADQVGRRARADLPPGGDLRRAFLAEYWRASFRQSMLFHEGRHALDKSLVRGLARFNDSNLEYRAKLSELALGDYPRLSLVNVNAAEIGSGSAHGKADAKVLQAYVEWMRGHAREIAGYDSTRPPLAQLDKLTDDQLRAVARGLDPIAK
ncbi:MAG TPA: hypothetical protein VF535_09730 [Allosphingosinicella sp.]